MKIVFVLMVHRPDDERVWFQQAESLREAGHEIFIISACTEKSGLPGTCCFDGRKLPKKELIHKLASLLKEEKPDTVICDNPVAVLAAKLFKQKTSGKVRVLYDITEWYPSKKNIGTLPLVKKIIKGALLSAASLYVGSCTDGFIFGEYYKAKPFRLFFPWKKHIYLSYYADVDCIKTYPLQNISSECNFLYSGKMTDEKGFGNILRVAFASAARFPEIRFILHIISGTEDYPLPTHLPANLDIIKTGFLPFPLFCEEVGKADIFLDLRQIDYENTHCLPIKLFYYMAAGRPVIYSDLKAIRKEIPEITEAGVLADPEDISGIVDKIGIYLKNEELYRTQCVAARKLMEGKYNWKKIKPRFIAFIATE
jgi:glycosyltransferase involved in cell wall biosynthesis